MPIDGSELRRAVLEVVSEADAAGNIQSGTVLRAAAERLGMERAGKNDEDDQALLTFWSDLFRTGYLAWGLNLLNAEPPHCHVTKLGREALQHIGRDPANPDGYMAHLLGRGRIGPIAESYIREALQAYNTTCYKAAAVMVGVASEALILDLRDALVSRLSAEGKGAPRALTGWLIKQVLDALEKDLDQRKGEMEGGLAGAYEAYWSAFVQQIRTIRNDSGHPKSVDPVEQETVHASLLIFPELTALADRLTTWIQGAEGDKAEVARGGG